MLLQYQIITPILSTIQNQHLKRLRKHSLLHLLVTQMYAKIKPHSKLGSIRNSQYPNIVAHVQPHSKFQHYKQQQNQHYNQFQLIKSIHLLYNQTHYP